jgi:hypothetical protein
MKWKNIEIAQYATKVRIKESQTSGIKGTRGFTGVRV